MSLYKYLHPDRIDVLIGKSIRFSSPAALNDPFEMKPHLEVLASQEYLDEFISENLSKLIHEELAKLPSEIKARISDEELNKIFHREPLSLRTNIGAMSQLLLSKLQEVMARKFEELIGILCLSESAESLLMWAHYADAHRGFVIGFDERSSFFDHRVGLDNDFSHLHQVSYCVNRPALSLADTDNIAPFITKGIDWKYEKEWRMIAPLQKASKTIGDGVNAIHLFDFPPQAITSVILGARMDTEKSESIQQILADSPEFSHVRCLQAEIDVKNYLLHMRRRPPVFSSTKL